MNAIVNNEQLISTPDVSNQSRHTNIENKQNRGRNILEQQLPNRQFDCLKTQKYQKLRFIIISILLEFKTIGFG